MLKIAFWLQILYKQKKISNQVRHQTWCNRESGLE